MFFFGWNASYWDRNSWHDAYKIHVSWFCQIVCACSKAIDRSISASSPVAYDYKERFIYLYVLKCEWRLTPVQNLTEMCIDGLYIIFVMCQAYEILPATSNAFLSLGAYFSLFNIFLPEGFIFCCIRSVCYELCLCCNIIVTRTWGMACTRYTCLHSTKNQLKLSHHAGYVCLILPDLA